MQKEQQNRKKNRTLPWQEELGKQGSFQTDSARTEKKIRLSSKGTG